MGLQGLLQEEAIHETKAVSWGDLPPTGRREWGAGKGREGGTDKQRDRDTERQEGPTERACQAVALGGPEATRHSQKSLFFVLTVP